MEKCKIDDSVRRRSLLLPWSKVIQIVTRLNQIDGKETVADTFVNIAWPKKH